MSDAKTIAGTKCNETMGKSIGRSACAEVSTSSMEYIYVYGGQTLGGFDNTLLRYRISTDLWEDWTQRRLDEHHYG